MYLQSSIREANSMNKAQLVQALVDYRAGIGNPYKYGTPGWMTVAELRAAWLEVYGVKELTS